MKKYILGLVAVFILSFLLVPSFSFAENLSSSESSFLSITNNLKYKDRDVNKNGEVSRLQSFLRSTGYLNTDPTGYFGQLTLQAVKDFQKDNNINSIGQVGPMTRAAILDSIKGNGVENGIPITPTDLGITTNGTGSLSVSGVDSINVNKEGSWVVHVVNPNSSTFTYSVYFGDGTYYIPLANNPASSVYRATISRSASFTHTYTKAGTYIQTFFVVNNKGQIIQTTKEIEVTNDITIPIVPTSSLNIISIVGPQILNLNQQGTWFIKASDPSNSALTYSVDWGDAGVVCASSEITSCTKPTVPFQQSPSFTHTYSKAGIYPLVFTVKNSTGKTAQMSLSVQVGNTATTVGTITASDCTIPSGGNSCHSNLTWNVSHSTSGITPRVLINKSVNGNSNILTVATGNSGVATYPLSYGDNAFSLVDYAGSTSISTAIASQVAKASCASGTYWNLNSCLPNSISSLNKPTGLRGEFVSPSLIKLTWDSVLPVGYKGGYNIYKNGVLFGSKRTDYYSNGKLADATPTLFYDSAVNCNNNYKYKIEIFKYNENWTTTQSGIFSDEVSVNALTCPGYKTEVLSPNGGESYKQGDTVTINWKAFGLGNNNSVAVSVFKYRPDNNYSGIKQVFGKTWYNDYNDTDGTLDSGSYTWTIPSTVEDGEYVVFVGGASSKDTSDKPFTISSTAEQIPVIDISANPKNIPYNGSSEIKWLVTGKGINVTSCRSSWSSVVAPSGTFSTGALTASKTYTITCAGSNGINKTASVVVLVDKPQELILKISAERKEVVKGGGTIISWSATGRGIDATSCKSNWSSVVPPSGTLPTGSLASEKTYTITCTDNLGVSKTVSVTVKVDESIEKEKVSSLCPKRGVGSQNLGCVSSSFNQTSMYQGTTLVGQEFIHNSHELTNFTCEKEFEKCGVCDDGFVVSEKSKCVPLDSRSVCPTQEEGTDHYGPVNIGSVVFGVQKMMSPYSMSELVRIYGPMTENTNYRVGDEQLLKINPITGKPFDGMIYGCFFCNEGYKVINRRCELACPEAVPGSSSLEGTKFLGCGSSLPPNSVYNNAEGVCSWKTQNIQQCRVCKTGYVNKNGSCVLETVGANL